MKKCRNHLIANRDLRFKMDGSLNNFASFQIPFVLMLLVFISISWLVLLQLKYPLDFLVRDDLHGLQDRKASAGTEFIEATNVADSEIESIDLEKVLKESAMESNTVILTTLNEAWAAPNSIFDLFIESFLIGNGTRKLLNHLVIVAFDNKAYAQCLSMNMHCFALSTNGVDFSGEKYFMTSGYLKMMWQRIDFLRDVLELGYNFVFTDADIMWFRDPFPYLTLDADFQIACDHFMGNIFDFNNIPNGGFIYVKSNNRTIEFYKFWYSSRVNHPGYHDQDVLNAIKQDPFLNEIGLKMSFLDTAYFGGFCEPSKDLDKVYTMHANCCLGLTSKLHDLKITLEDWRKFMALPPTIKRAKQLSWRVPQNCSMASLYSSNPRENVEREGMQFQLP